VARRHARGEVGVSARRPRGARWLNLGPVSWLADDWRQRKACEEAVGLGTLAWAARLVVDDRQLPLGVVRVPVHSFRLLVHEPHGD